MPGGNFSIEIASSVPMLLKDPLATVAIRQWFAY